jgi:hypothetical protein
MSNIASLTVFDGAATPVSHTLLPISVTREKGVVKAEWRESITTLPAYAQITASMTIEKMKSGVYKTETRVNVPVMESIAGQNAAGYTAAPKVAYTNQFVMTGWNHERSTIADRRLARQIAINLAGNISTTVTAATAGFAPELYDQLVAPT